MTTTRRSALGGYTIIELMMALTVLAIGVSGVIAMQKVTVASNVHAKNLSIATHIAQLWLDRLTADGAQWNHPSPRRPGFRDIATHTTWLRNVEGNNGLWLRPAFDATLGAGPAFTALGFDTNDMTKAQFCTHVRLSWMYSDTVGNNQPVEGNGLIRTEVRVFWLRDDAGGPVTSAGVCDPNADVTVIGDAVNDYHFVYMTSSVKQATAR